MIKSKNVDKTIMSKYLIYAASASAVGSIIGIAAGFHFDHPEDPIALETSSYAKENGIAAALEKYCDITDAADVEMVSKFYDMLGNKATFAELCEALSDYKYRD